MKKMIEEIIRKAENMNYWNLSIAGAAHIEQHVDQTDEELISRRKAEHLPMVSAFTDINTMNVVLWECFTDEYTVKQIAKWLLESKTEVLNLDGCCFTMDTIGKIAVPNGAVIKVTGWRIGLQRRDLYERNLTTGMPFDVKTIFPTE